MKFKFALLLLLSFSLTLKAQNDKKQQQLESIAEEILAAMEEENQGFLDELFDTEAFSDRFIVEGTSGDLKSFNEGFLSSLKERSLLSAMLLQNVALSGSDYEFVRAYFDKKDAHLIFRLYGEAGLNYHDFLLRKIKGAYKVVDIYVYLSGELLTDTFKRIYLMSGKDFLSATQAEGMPDLEMEDLSKVMTAKGLTDRGEYEAANEVIEGLSEQVKSEKLFKLVELLIKSNLGEDEYLEVMEDYKKSFPDDPSIDLMSIDYFLLREEFEAAQRAIDNLDKRVGGDLFLDLQRGSIYYMAGDLQKAEDFLIKFIGSYPESLDGWDSLLSVYIDAGKFKQAAGSLDKLLEIAGIDGPTLQEIIEQEPTFADFVKSKEYKSWKEG